MNRLVFLVCAIPMVFLAQQNEREMALQQYQKKVDSIVLSEKEKMNISFEKLEKEHSEGKISKEEFLHSKKEISEKTAQNLNEKLDKEQQIFKDLTKKLAMSSVYSSKMDTLKDDNSQEKTLLIVDKNKEKHPKKALDRNLLQINYAFLNLTDKGSFNPFNSDSKMRIGNSHSVEVARLTQRQIGKNDSPFFIRYGLSYRSDTYMPKRPLVVAQNENTQQISLEEFTKGTLKRSKLRNVYLTIPVDFYWVLNPKYVDYQGERYLDGKKNQWRIGVGAYAGVNLRSIVKVKYYDAQGDFDKYKYTLDNGVNRFLFGLKFGVKYNGFDLFIKKDLTPIFNQKTDFPYKNAIHLGINIGNLQF